MTWRGVRCMCGELHTDAESWWELWSVVWGVIGRKYYLRSREGA